MSVFKGIHFWF